MTLSALYEVAAELGELAKSSLPVLREGEKISREWLADGIYYRETILFGRKNLVAYNFRQRLCEENKQCVLDFGR